MYIILFLVMHKTTTQCQFDSMLVRTSYHDNIVTACADHNYSQVVDVSTKAITYIRQYKLVEALNIRAHAYGHKGYFDKATQDAKRMIKYAPEWSIGYLR